MAAAASMPGREERQVGHAAESLWCGRPACPGRAPMAIRKSSGFATLMTIGAAPGAAVAEHPASGTPARAWAVASASVDQRPAGQA